MKDRTFKAIIGSDNPLETARVLLAPYNMQTLNTKVNACTLCSNKNNKEMSYGNPNANILIITDYATDIQEYKNLFKDLLNRSNIVQSDIFVTPSVRCICREVIMNTDCLAILNLKIVNNIQILLLIL